MITPTIIRFIFLCFSALILLAAPQVTAQEPAATAEDAEKQLDQYFQVEGASVTRGEGTYDRMDLVDRIKLHFATESKNSGVTLAKLVGTQQIFLGMDYFFPTHSAVYPTPMEPEAAAVLENFNSVDKKDPLALAKAIAEASAWYKEYFTKQLVELLKEHDYLLIGDVFYTEHLNPAAQQRVKEDPDKFAVIVHYKDFWEVMLNEAFCSVVNKAILEFADENSDRVFVLRTATFVEELTRLVMSGGKTIVGEDGKEVVVMDVMEDAITEEIHFTETGVAIYFNTVIKPALEQIDSFKGKVPDMPIPYEKKRSSDR